MTEYSNYNYPYDQSQEPQQEQQPQPIDKLISTIREENEDLRGDIQSLRVEISRLADAITNQTAFMQQYVNIESGRTIMEPVEIPTVSIIEPIPVKFPIGCDSDLLCLNEYITADTRDYYVNRMKSIIGVGSLSRSLKGILTAKLIMDYNLEGVNNKKELRCFNNYISALFGDSNG
ncbi:uncharacterized protein Dana_GF27686 [Drosophila ananassae]|uniref:DUF4806 domain-containing protein n=1 Tax=Drosophila ananassae TaxID=7217 RepID=A0A0P8XYJ9_DROAN|nr:uncharacterized protein Dana_GF27686 [Drosophila ananassae]